MIGFRSIYTSLLNYLYAGVRIVYGLSCEGASVCSDINNLNFTANRYTESRYVTESFGRVTNYCCAAFSGLLPRVAYSCH